MDKLNVRYTNNKRYSACVIGKMLSIVILIFSLLFASVYAESSSAIKMIGTLRILFTDGSQKQCLIFRSEMVDDKVQIENVIKEQYGNVKVQEILELDGRPLKNTEYSKYAGIINHKPDPGKDAQRLGNDTLPNEFKDYRNPGNEDIEGEGEIKIKVGDKLLSFDDEGSKPYVKDARTMVPFRAIFEAVGADVGYRSISDDIKAIWATCNGIRIEMKIGDYKAYQNGKVLYMDTVPEFHNGKVFIPMEFASDLLGMDIIWDKANNTVILTNRTGGPAYNVYNDTSNSSKNNGQ